MSKKGDNAARLGKQKKSRRGGAGIVKRTVVARTNKRTAKPKARGQTRGKGQALHNAVESPPPSNNSSDYSSRRRSGSTNPSTGDQATHFSHTPVNQTSSWYRPGGALLPGGKRHLSFDFPTTYQASRSDRAGSSITSNQVNPSSQYVGAYWLPGAMPTFWQASGYQSSSQALPSAPGASQIPVTYGRQFLHPSPGVSFAPVKNNQWGQWEFDTRHLIIPVPSYTYSLPRTQQQAIQMAASQAFGLMKGWVAADLYSLNSAMSRVTNQQALDVIKTVNSAQKGRGANPHLNPSNEQAGTSNPQARSSNPLGDVVFYQKPISANDACLNAVAENDADSEVSYKPFDMTPYSLQTGEEGRWFDPRFELAGLHPFGNRLIAGINCPPNLLQQCNLTVNPYGVPPRLVPHATAFQCHSSQLKPRDVVINDEGADASSRGNTTIEPLHIVPNSSQQRIDNAAAEAYTLKPAAFTSHLTQLSRVGAPQPDSPATCDSHDCDKELRIQYITCARCHRARYCDNFCQVFTWLVHLPTCSLHPDATAQEVTALETWATEVWNAAAKAVEEAMRDDRQTFMDVDEEDRNAVMTEPAIIVNSDSILFTTSEEVVTDDEEREDPQDGNNAIVSSRFTAPDDFGVTHDREAATRQDGSETVDAAQTRPSENTGMAGHKEVNDMELEDLETQPLSTRIQACSQHNNGAAGVVVKLSSRAAAIAAAQRVLAAAAPGEEAPPHDSSHYRSRLSRAQLAYSQMGDLLLDSFDNSAE